MEMTKDVVGKRVLLEEDGLFNNYYHEANVIECDETEKYFKLEMYNKDGSTYFKWVKFPKSEYLKKEYTLIRILGDMEK
jgi:hypothetical protein